MIKMSLLQFILIISAVVFFFFAIDAYQRKKFNFLHFLVFIGGASFIGLFAYNIDYLNRFGAIFGVARGADVLVYIVLIFLGYMYFQLLHKVSKNEDRFTKLLRELSINDSIGTLSNGTKNVFVIPAYNESDNALNVVEDILNKGNEYGVVFIDDGSSNDLYDKLLFKFRYKNCVIIKHIINMGQGAALQTGFDYILKRTSDDLEYIVTFDSDGQHRLLDFENFIDAFKKNNQLEIVLGSRFLGKA